MDRKFRMMPYHSDRRWVATTMLMVCMGLSSCGNRDGLAPVTELSRLFASTLSTQHRVVRGETLHAIAFRYDVNFQQLVRLNHLHHPYKIRVGQIIYLRAPIKQAPVVKQTTPRRLNPIQTTPVSSGQWLWPISGRVQSRFLPQQGQKGLDIIGRKGDRIHASSNGIVAYSGNGLHGYGNLIIIKHDHQFLTAYGNNARNLVKEGQHIKAGQVIAIIGLINREDWGVHFEIRKAGEPLNPMNYLSGRR